MYVMHTHLKVDLIIAGRPARAHARNNIHFRAHNTCACEDAAVINNKNIIIFYRRMPRRQFVFVVATLFLVCLLYYVYVLNANGCNGIVSWNDVEGYSSRTVLPLVSKDILVRSVYFDDRSRSGHANASVFMVEAVRSAVDDGLIIGCQVGDNFGVYIQVRRLTEIELYVHKKHSYVTHDLIMVDCFDLPVKNGSRAFLFFKKKNNSTSDAGIAYSVESERSLFFPSPRISRGKEIKLLVCVATARYTAYGHRLTIYNLIYNWLKYQRTIGVDHVHFIAHPSFLTVGTLENDVMRRAILDNFISIEFWEPWLNETDNYHGHSQMLAYQDCAYRFRGTYDYIMMCDTDDFFVPRVANQPTFQYYIKQWCRYGMCKFPWAERYPDCGLNKERMTPDGNITSVLTSQRAVWRREPKSLHVSSSVLDVGIHRPLETMPGVSVTHVPNNIAYFAHIRHGKTPDGGFDNCYIQTRVMISHGKRVACNAIYALPNSLIDRNLHEGPGLEDTQLQLHDDCGIIYIHAITL